MIVRAAVDVAVGTVFCCLGGVLMLWAPRRALGCLLLATGAAWLLGTVWPAAVFLHRGPLIQLLVCYPGWRPASRLEVLVVILGYFDAIVLVGGNQWVTAVLAVLVLFTALVRMVGASGALRRARVSSSVVCAVLMSILGVGAAARLAGLGVDPWVVAIYQVALLGSGVTLFADVRWGSWNRSAMARLVIDLGDPEDRGTVRDKLAKALGDPGLEIGFPGPDGSWVDEGGQPVTLSSPGPAQIARTLHRNDREIAKLLSAAGTLDDPKLLDSVTALSAMVYENALLQAGLRDLVVQTQNSRRRIVEVADTERRELAAELRSGAQANLARVRLLLDPADALAGLLQQARSAVSEFAQGIYPRTLEKEGLRAACRQLARSVSPAVQVDVPVIRLLPVVELTLYFVCAEALTNIDKHAQASAVRLVLQRSTPGVRLVITDNGRGGVAGNGAVSTNGTGLRGMADRLAAIGGTLVIDSPPGCGTTVIAELPQVLIRM